MRSRDLMRSARVICVFWVAVAAVEALLLGACSDREVLLPAAGQVGSAGGGAGQVNTDGAVGDGGGDDAAGPPPAPIIGQFGYPYMGCDHVGVHAQCVDGWCTIPSGCFVMGSPETEWGRGMYTEDQAVVTLTHAFVVQQYELTQGEWTAMGLANPSGLDPDGTGDCVGTSCPVGNMTWYSAVEFANRLSQARSLAPCYTLGGCTGEPGPTMKCASVSLTTASVYECSGYRLPTTAEWEYAARAGTRTAFYSGPITPQTVNSTCFDDANLDPIAWYCTNSAGLTHPIGLKAPNAWGLYDMLGNVEEWASDPKTGNSVVGPATDPLGGITTTLKTRSIRGGLFRAWSSILRAACQMGGGAELVGHGAGFRLVKSLP